MSLANIVGLLTCVWVIFILSSLFRTAIITNDKVSIFVIGFISIPFLFGVLGFILNLIFP